MKGINKIRLLLPSPEMKNRVLAYREAFIMAGEKAIPGSGELQSFEKFEEWMHGIQGTTPPGVLPSTTYFAIRLSDSAIVGTVNIRHCLDEARYHNGHIGYAVVPRERGKGYGKEILRLALIKAEELGIIETVVACNKNNRVSKAVIEKNGLEFVNQFIDTDGSTVLIYVKR